MVIISCGDCTVASQQIQRSLLEVELLGSEDLELSPMLLSVLPEHIFIACACTCADSATCLSRNMSRGRARPTISIVM